MNSFAWIRSRPARFVIAAALAGAILGGLASRVFENRFNRWEVSLAFTINQRPRQETKDFAYDGYYALKASELFADTLISWFKTPAVIGDVYDGQERAVRAAAGFRAKKLSSQSVVILFREQDRAIAEDLAKRLSALMIKKTGELNQNAKGESLFVLIPSDPVIVDAWPSPARAGGAGFVLGGVLAALVLYLATPPKKENAPT